MEGGETEKKAKAGAVRSGSHVPSPPEGSPRAWSQGPVIPGSGSLMAQPVTCHRWEPGTMVTTFPLHRLHAGDSDMAPGHARRRSGRFELRLVAGEETTAPVVPIRLLSLMR